MLLSRRAYQDLQNELVKNREEARAQVQANLMLEATLNWLRHRVTQMESERAILLHKFMDIKIQTPAFERVQDTSLGVQQAKNLIERFSEMDIFAGLSDEEARKQGVELDSDGRLKD